MRCRMRLIRPTWHLQCIELARFGRPDKAFTPHPAAMRGCLMRRWLNCTPNVGHNLTSEGAVYETFI
ncbi:hypothetical protein AOY95_17565 [Escherichia coli]|nr:hypothetical protein AOY95_17565 [Escherichia coli]